MKKKLKKYLHIYVDGLIYLHVCNSANREENQLATEVQMLVSNVIEKKWLLTNNEDFAFTKFATPMDLDLDWETEKIVAVYPCILGGVIKVQVQDSKTGVTSWYSVKPKNLKN